MDSVVLDGVEWRYGYSTWALWGNNSEPQQRACRAVVKGPKRKYYGCFEAVNEVASSHKSDQKDVCWPLRPIVIFFFFFFFFVPHATPLPQFFLHRRDLPLSTSLILMGGTRGRSTGGTQLQLSSCPALVPAPVVSCCGPLGQKRRQKVQPRRSRANSRGLPSSLLRKLLPRRRRRRPQSVR